MPFGFLKRRQVPDATPPETPEAAILAVLDQGCRDMVFPMLDNGYVYLAAARLVAAPVRGRLGARCSRSSASRRAPAHRTVSTWSFGSRLANRKVREDYVSDEAYRNYLHVHPHDDAACLLPA